MADLLTAPLWRAEDLGRPLPDSLHACSVCLPTWGSVVGYEEADPEVTSRMRAGYPRFFCHPHVVSLFARAAEKLGAPGQKALVSPTPAAAQTAADYILRGSEIEGVAVRRLGDGSGTAATIFDAPGEKAARLYWRFSGQIVSSRLAEAILNEWSPAQFAETEAEGEAARQRIRERLAAIAGQPAANIFLFSSGMAGVFAVQRAVTVARAGQHTAQLGFPYVDVLKVQEEFGAGVHFLPGVDGPFLAQLEAIAAAGPLAGVYTELPSNPLLETTDLPRLAAMARAHDFPLIIDDTIATSVNVDLMPHADIVTTSLTKAFSGAGDVIAGAVTLNEASPWAAALRASLAYYEKAAPLFGLDAVVLEKNSRDFTSRVQRMSATARAVAEWLHTHPAISRVYYPSLQGRAEYDALRRSPDSGYGMLLSFTLKDESATPGFFDRWRVSKGPSLGANFSLACPFTLLAHYTELEWAASCGVSAHLIRFSAGLEEPDDLIARLQEALG